jgi:RNA polymerase sigma-70 factor (ECF subfamily)
VSGGVEAACFEAERRRLTGLAYRMLGTWADAEDVVQDVWLKAQAAEGVERPAAWLTTVTTRTCLDRLRATRRRREEYVGPWLPEPVVSEPGPDDVAELSESLTLGFLTVLDRLQPIERAVFLLADVFSVGFSDIAATVGRSEVACRQIASRARRRLAPGPARHPTGTERRVVDELLVALATGDMDAALRRLAPDVVCVSDGGAKARAARRPVVGADRVARLLVNLAQRAPASMSVAPATVNGDPGFVVSIDGAVDFVAAFDVEDERVAAIWIIRNPDKLEHVGDHLALV